MTEVGMKEDKEAGEEARQRSPYWRVVRISLASAIFFSHATATVLVLISFRQSDWWGLLLSPALLLLLSNGLKCRQLLRGGTGWAWLESPRLSASVLLYLLCVVPSLWLIQLSYATEMEAVASAASPGQAQDPVAQLLDDSVVMEEEDGDWSSVGNETLTDGNRTLPSTELAKDTTANSRIYVIGGLRVMIGLELTNHLRREIIKVLEQTIVLTLIVGRWILPKGQISRDQLSQMLLVWLAMGADIVDLYDHLINEQISHDLRLTYLILGSWTVSLVQFPCNLASFRSAKKYQLAGAMREQLLLNPLVSGYMRRSRSFLFRIVTDQNFHGIATATLLQDAPFLVIRVYMLVAMDIASQTLVFFTCKNSLVVLLQVYRLYVICARVREDEHTFKETMKSMGVAARKSLSMMVRRVGAEDSAAGTEEVAEALVQANLLAIAARETEAALAVNAANAGAGLPGTGGGGREGPTAVAVPMGGEPDGLLVRIPSELGPRPPRVPSPRWDSAHLASKRRSSPGLLQKAKKRAHFEDDVREAEAGQALLERMDSEAGKSLLSVPSSELGWGFVAGRDSRSPASSALGPAWDDAEDKDSTTGTLDSAEATRTLTDSLTSSSTPKGAPLAPPPELRPSPLKRSLPPSRPKRRFESSSDTEEVDEGDRTRRVRLKPFLSNPSLGRKQGRTRPPPPVPMPRVSKMSLGGVPSSMLSSSGYGSSLGPSSGLLVKSGQKTTLPPLCEDSYWRNTLPKSHRRASLNPGVVPVAPPLPPECRPREPRRPRGPGEGRSLAAPFFSHGPATLYEDSVLIPVHFPQPSHQRPGRIPLKPTSTSLWMVWGLESGGRAEAPLAVSETLSSDASSSLRKPFTPTPFPRSAAQRQSSTELSMNEHF